MTKKESESEAEAKKTRMKESESEAEAKKKKEAKKDAEAEAEAKKKPTHEEDGQMVKESESEAEDEDEDEEEDESEKEAESESEDEDEDEDEEESEEEKRKKKKEARKGEMGGENPSESADAGAAGPHTTTAGAVIGTHQNVFNPSTAVSVGRNATGSSPSETHYSGKSANLELKKSPLFMELSKQMAALEKSLMDRLTNVQKTVARVEKFYQQPFYKAIDENASPESVQKMSVSEQIQKGKVRFTD